jgi:hypothetical protein
MAPRPRPIQRQIVPTLSPRHAVGFCLIAVSGLVFWLWQAQSERALHDKTAQSNARALIEAASEWRASKPKLGCPTVSQLLADHELSDGKVSADAWGGRYRILCSGGNVQLLSAGPDGEFQTTDDVTIAGDMRS